MNQVQAVILAAGASSRFGLNYNKLLAPVCGLPLILHVIRALEPLDMSITAVIGNQREAIKNTIELYKTKQKILFAVQETQQGTGHALVCSKEFWFTDTILVLNGDMPLITTSIIADLCQRHYAQNADVSFVIAQPPFSNHGYGRVLSTESGIHIIEAKDFAGDPARCYPINAGIYLFKRSFLESSLHKLTAVNAKNEFYLTDLIAIASYDERTVVTLEVPFERVQGVNTIEELVRADKVERARLLDYWMRNNVLCIMPETIRIDVNVIIGPGTVLHPGVQLRGMTIVGAGCEIDSYSIIEDVIIPERTTIKPYTWITHAHKANNFLVDALVVHGHTKISVAE